MSTAQQPQIVGKHDEARIRQIEVDLYALNRQLSHVESQLRFIVVRLKKVLTDGVKAERVPGTPLLSG
jgi:hypothetical protein